MSHESEIGENSPVILQEVKRYNAGPLTPVVVSETFQTIWQIRGQWLGMQFDVPNLSISPEELDGLAKRGRRLTYVPPELTNQDWIGLFEDLFPNVGREALPLRPGNDWEEGAFIWHVHEYGGYISVESSLDSPNPDTTEPQLRKLFSPDTHLIGMRYPTYIIASHDSKLFTDHYFDENSWSRLIYSYVSPFISLSRQNILASFNIHGHMRMSWGTDPNYHDLYLGGRSEELVQTQLAEWTPWGTLLKAA